MAAPVLASQGVLASVTTGNLTVANPPNTLNDILVVTTVAWVPNTTTGANTIAAPAGWTKFTPAVTTITGGLIDAEYAFFWKRTAGSEPNPTFVRPTGWDTGTDTAWSGYCVGIRGCKRTGDPWDEITNTAISTAANPDFPAVTVSGTQRLVVVFAVKTDDTALPNAVAGWTQSLFLSSTLGTDTSVRYYYVANTSTSVAAVTPTGGVAPAQGGSVYFGVSFAPPPTLQRTITGSGTGTQSATATFFTPVVFSRTASGFGLGAQTATKLNTLQKTATGAGTGTESATGSVVTGSVATGFGAGTETATTLLTVIRSASGSGTSTSVSDDQHTFSRSAIGSGTGTSLAHIVVGRFRTGSGTGLGTTGGFVTFTITPVRTATGTGLGTSSTVSTTTPARIATGTGLGSSVAIKYIPAIGINWSYWGTNAMLGNS